MTSTNSKRWRKRRRRGPWEDDEDGIWSRKKLNGYGGFTQVAPDLSREDQAFIAAANPETVLELVAEAKRLREENARLRKACPRCLKSGAPLMRGGGVIDPVCEESSWTANAREALR